MLMYHRNADSVPIHKKTLIVFMLGLLLQGCAKNTSYSYTQERPSLPSYLPPPDPNKIRLERKLNAEEIKVIQTGQYILLSIPSGLLFAEYSPNISWPSYGYLNDVACYLKMFRKVEIDINVFDAYCDKHQRMIALTRLRASRIADYLISQGIDSRIVFTRGMGNDKPIMKTIREEDKLGNSRVEVLFKEEII